MPLGRGLEVIPGTRLLSSTFGLIGKAFFDPVNNKRLWTVANELRPVQSYKEHIRLRVIDQYGFVSFINEMDYELLYGSAKPGDMHPIREVEYPEIGDTANGWVGLHADDGDLQDDLHIRELELRQQYGWDIVLPSMELTRYVHSSSHRDEKRLELLLWDADPETGLGPDMRLETIDKRWVRVEAEAVQWQ